MDPRVNGWRYESWLVGVLLLTHAGLLAWMAARHAPTTDEPGYLVAGLSHLELGRFELGRVNPPLVRTVAAVPVAMAGVRTDWSKVDGRPGARAEWAIANQFLADNGDRSFWLFTLARWACIPFSLLGGWVCYRWARDLYGSASGLLALALWCTCPNVLGHAQLLTTDVGAAALAALACYAFWRWLLRPGWRAAVLAGLALGLAELTKTSLLVLYPLWPLTWATWRLGGRARPGEWGREAVQLAAVLALALVVLNAGYEFDGVLRPLGEYRFVSQALAGPDAGRTGNRFESTWAAGLPVPLPQHYLLGVDTQKVDFESNLRSYLRGEWKEGGWWYYYLYALAVKVPLGTWALLVLAAAMTLRKPAANAGWWEEGILLSPAAVIFVLVSSQTGFTHHLKYVLPAFPFVFVWVSKVAHPHAFSRPQIRAVVGLLLLWVIVSSLRVYPHSLSYFNELAGGPERGHEHLHGSNLDWGQDLLYLKRWLNGHPEARPINLAYYGVTDPALAGITYTMPPRWPEPGATGPAADRGPRPGWYAVSANYLSGHRFPMHDGRGGWFRPTGHPFGYFQRFRPVARAGYSILIYHVDLSEANRVRRELGLPDFVPELASDPPMHE